MFSMGETRVRALDAGLLVSAGGRSVAEIKMGGFLRVTYLRRSGAAEAMVVDQRMEAVASLRQMCHMKGR